MRVSGFSIARNAVEYGYPIVEAVSSILPLCDELIINVGVSDDGTVELIRSIRSPKITILERTWDMTLREGGRVISIETNEALTRCTGDWCFYIQADEVLHEKYYDAVSAAMMESLDDGRVEALQFRYKHFYGSFDYYQDNNRRWYTKECRVIRRHADIVSWGDGMDFRHRDGRRLRHRRIKAEIYHYGWVRPPRTMKTKQTAFLKLYHSDRDIPEGEIRENMYSDLGNLRRFKETHPSVMQKRIAESNWDFDAGIENQPPDWIRRSVNFLHPLTKRLRRLKAKLSG